MHCAWDFYTHTPPGATLNPLLWNQAPDILKACNYRKVELGERLYASLAVLKGQTYLWEAYAMDLRDVLKRLKKRAVTHTFHQPKRKGLGAFALTPLLFLTSKMPLLGLEPKTR